MTPSPAQFARPRLASTALIFAAALACLADARAQGVSQPVGRIDGDAVSVHGDVELVKEDGRTYTAFASGSQVTVRAGRARVQLSGGGEIGICGPARFSLVRAGASFTLALDYGRIRARVDHPGDLRIYTPQIVVTPVSTAGHADDISVGLEEGGRMCVRAAAGALRLEPQFGGDNIVVPQSMEATLLDGRLSSLADAPRACACDALESKPEPPVLPAHAEARITLPAPGATPASPAPEPEKKSPEKPPEPQPATPEQPIWKVFMPPLAFDSSAPIPQSPPRPETVRLFREVVVEPTIVFRGEVDSPPAAPPPVPAKSKTNAAPEKGAASSETGNKPSFGARVKNFFRRLFGGKAKKDSEEKETKTGAAAFPSAYIPS
jgi:hypothetical protein